jgi:NADPH-dependent ferric siderophore reductase
VSTRASQHSARVEGRDELSPHLVRLTLEVDPSFRSTGIPDEWVGLVVPGQFQSRYYTVRSVAGSTVVLDVVLHEVGLVTEWVAREDCVGSTVTITEAKGSFDPPPEAGWLLLVGDLTGLPAMARIAESTSLPTRIWAEVEDALPGYLPDTTDVTWLEAPSGGSRLAEVVESLEWPAGEGYFWMAGESAQMRSIRKHLMRDRRLPTTAYDVMGYWRASAGRQPRSVDPGPVWRAGKAQGLSDEQIWAQYDSTTEKHEARS